MGSCPAVNVQMAVGTKHNFFLVVGVFFSFFFSSFHLTGIQWQLLLDVFPQKLSPVCIITVHFLSRLLIKFRQ